VTLRTTSPPARPTTDHVGRPISVALVGVDGAGKSTISRLLESTPLPRPAKHLYMGVNLEASSLMLPTTRLLLAAKRARGRRPDLVAGDAAGAGGSTRAAVRMSVWILEEWLRQVVAAGYRLRGYIVVFDRHFLADYYHADVAPAARRSTVSRLHGWLLSHAYPRPDLVICLDARAEVVYARKPEAHLDWLRRRREEYLSLGAVFPSFVVVDAEQPVDRVLADIATRIRLHCEGARP
jgi:thymidylate kinase